MKDNYKNKILVLTILTIVFTIMGSTLAFWNWNTSEAQKTLIGFTVAPNLSCTGDGGGNIGGSEKKIVPTSCTNETYAIQRTITLNTSSTISTNDIFLNLWLDVIDIGEGLSNSKNFKYAITKTPNDCTTDAITGSFNGVTNGGRVNLLTNKEYIGTNQDTYYLYIWLDSAETSASTTNQSFELKLGGSCQDDIPPPPKPYQEPLLNGNGPVLDNAGMIPVTIDNSGNVTTISMESSDWYSYEDKKWANAILVTESSRANYLNTNGVPVTKSDILAYYVWIPAYSYKMNSSSGAGNESEISISWNYESYSESGYIPHPAFKFPNILFPGFWVGKFETTGTATQPTILNGVSPLVSQTISAQFTSSLLFANGTFDDTNRTITFANSPTYGLSSTTDSHMMKNSEWGAVAYLSHSQYGTCTDGVCQEIRINNTYQTGCGAATPETTSTSTTCTLAYGSGISEYPQSTTGNITGVFDISGGAAEYVMGNYNNTKGSYWSYTNLPPTKYYDVYTTLAACTQEKCGGHALKETSGWYGDMASFVDSNLPWFIRSGHNRQGPNAGAFLFLKHNGNSNSNFSWRSVLFAR